MKNFAIVEKIFEASSIVLELYQCGVVSIEDPCALGVYSVLMVSSFSVPSHHVGLC